MAAKIRKKMKKSLTVVITTRICYNLPEMFIMSIQTNLDPDPLWKLDKRGVNQDGRQNEKKKMKKSLTVVKTSIIC